MNRKKIYLMAGLLLAVFTAGIFTEILMPDQNLKFPEALPSAGVAALDYIKDDMVVTFAFILFSFSRLLFPLACLMTLGKTFSLGFSAAYLLSSAAEAGPAMVFTALLPRGMFKLPAYLMLLSLSFETACLIKTHRQSHPALLYALKPVLSRFCLCFLLMAFSSIIEVILLQIVL